MVLNCAFAVPRFTRLFVFGAIYEPANPFSGAKVIFPVVPPPIVRELLLSDWMDPEGGSESIRRLKRAGNHNTRMFIIPNAGHHGTWPSVKGHGLTRIPKSIWTTA